MTALLIVGAGFSGAVLARALAESGFDIHVIDAADVVGGHCHTARDTATGVMVHLVPDEGVDDGPVLATAPVEILPTDTLATLEERVHAIEHRLLVDTLHGLCTDRLAERTLTPRNGAHT